MTLKVEEKSIALHRVWVYKITTHEHQVYLFKTKKGSCDRWLINSRMFLALKKKHFNTCKKVVCSRIFSPKKVKTIRNSIPDGKKERGCCTILVWRNEWMRLYVLIGSNCDIWFRIVENLNNFLRQVIWRMGRICRLSALELKERAYKLKPIQFLKYNRNGLSPKKGHF